jgi:hypothetical protein
LSDKEGTHLVVNRVTPDELDLDFDSGLLLILLGEDLLRDRAPSRRQEDPAQRDPFLRTADGWRGQC